MEHSKVWIMLDEHHDGELSPDAASLVRNHLKACPECLEELAGRQILARTLSGTVTVQPSEEFVQGVNRVIAGATDGPDQPFGWPIPAMAVALAASALILAGLFSSTPSGQTGLVSATFEYENGGPMPVLEQGMEISSHDQVLSSLLEES